MEVYGSLVPQLEAVRTVGATVAGAGSDATQVPPSAYTGVNEPLRLRLTQGTSALGFRGRFGLHENLSVIWQIESGVPIDGDLLGNTIASRNSRLGLTGNWGTLFAGIWDSPYKWANLPINNPVKAGIVPDYTSILGTPGFLVPALNLSPSYVADAVPGPSAIPRSNASFYRRDADVVQYWSPAFHGLSMRASYVIPESTRAAMPGAPEIRPSILSGLVSFDLGTLSLRYAAEWHRDYFGLSIIGGSPGGTETNPSSSDVGHVGVASYRIDWSRSVATRAVANVELLSYSDGDRIAGAVNWYRRPAFYGLVDQSYREHHLWATYGRAWEGDCAVVGGGYCSTAGLSAEAVTVGYLYRASRVTDFYVAYYTIVNHRAASYTPFPPLPPLPAPGANVQSVSIAMVHHFSAQLARNTAETKRPERPARPRRRARHVQKPRS